VGGDRRRPRGGRRVGGAKLRLAGSLHSSALRGDGVLSLAGAALAAVTLASLAFDAAFGWWWSDAVAALLMAAFLLPEGWLNASLTRHGQMLTSSHTKAA
jgi:divalent metal cation (Fe/Co/Zn/Cd) transporter